MHFTRNEVKPSDSSLKISNQKSPFNMISEFHKVCNSICTLLICMLKRRYAYLVCEVTICSKYFGILNFAMRLWFYASAYFLNWETSGEMPTSSPNRIRELQKLNSQFLNFALNIARKRFDGLHEHLGIFLFCLSSICSFARPLKYAIDFEN